MGAMPDNVEERFRSHKHYVEALAWVGGRTLLKSNKSALTDLAGRAAAAGLSDKAPRGIDYDQVHRSLRNAWSTELLLGLPSQWTEEDEFLRLSNSWGVIQAYYVGYHATQALVVAKGDARPASHPKSQQLYAALWVDRPLNLPPWTFGVASSGWKNVSPGAVIGPVHPWNGCNRWTCWSLAAKVLKSTRDDVVGKSMSDKRDEGQRTRKKQWEVAEATRSAVGKRPRKTPVFRRPQLTAAEKAACNRRVRTYTLMDYFWRLRVNANYDDAAIFLEGPDNDIDSYNVHTRMAFLAAGLALLTEMRIKQLVGPKKFYGWADDFIAKSIPSPYDLGIKLRRPLL
jgi:hypothetical protein